MLYGCGHGVDAESVGGASAHALHHGIPSGGHPDREGVSGAGPGAQKLPGGAASAAAEQHAAQPV